MRREVAVVLVAVMAAALLVATPTSSSAAVTLPTDFVIENVADVGGSFSSNGMAFVPGEPLFLIADNDGYLRLFSEDGTPHGEILDIAAAVNTYSDRGLTGIAVHPEFDRTTGDKRLVYLSYVWDPPGQSPDSSGRRISRVTEIELAPTLRDLGGGSLVESYEVVADSERVILGAAGMADPFQPTQAELDAVLGADPDCTATGNVCYPQCLDDGDPGNDPDCQPVETCRTDIGGFIPDCLGADDPLHNTGTLRFGPDGLLYVGHGDGSSAAGVDVRAVRVIDRDSLNGKVLRIDPETGLGVPGNPWWTGDGADNASRGFMRGFRNPFRFSVHPQRPDTVMVGDVGWTKWEEVNTGVGGNHGWPCYEGADGVTAENPNYQPQPACQELADAVAAGTEVVTPSLHAYQHPIEDDQFGGAAIIGGDWFLGDEWPLPYQDGWFFTDFDSATMRYLPAVRDGQGNVTGNSSTPVDFASGLGFVVDTRMGPDGTMWLLEIGRVDEQFNVEGTGRVRRIRFAGDDPNRAPIVSNPGNQDSGLGGSVNLEIQASDPDQQPLTFSADPAMPLPPGLDISPTGRIAGAPTTPGDYEVRVIADDGERQGSTTFQWHVDETYAPVANILTPVEGERFAIGDMVAMTGEASDVEDGELTGTSLQWDVQIRHADHVHPDEYTGTGTDLAPFWITDHGTDWYLVGCLQATDSAGYSDTACIDLRLGENDYTIRTDPPGLTFTFDDAAYTEAQTVAVYDNQRAEVSAPLTQDGLTFVGWSGSRAHTTDIIGGVTPTDMVARYAPVAAPANVGPSGVARQSTTHVYEPCGPHEAQRALDGDYAGLEQDCAISHTLGWNLDDWWEVDLGQVVLVEEIRVWNWTHHRLDRLSDGYVFISEQPFGDRTLDALLADDTIYRERFAATIGRPTAFTGGVRGQYVRVQIEAQDAEDYRPLVMSEVEVFAAAPRPPIAELTGPTEVVVEGDPAPFDASGSLDPDGSQLTFQWTVDGLPGTFDDPTSATPVLDTSGLADGEHTVEVTVTDADAETATAQVPLTIDALPEPPVAVIADPGGPFELGDVIGLDARSSTDPEGDDADLTFLWDLDADGTFDDAVVATTEIDSDLLGRGTHDVTVQVTSPATDLTSTASVSLMVQAPPVPDLAIPDGPHEIGTPVALDAEASVDPEGGELVAAWDLDDDGAFDDDTGLSIALDTSELVEGDHPVAVRVTSAKTGLAATATGTVTVEAPPEPPTIIISDLDGPYPAGSQVQLDASSSVDPEGGTLTFSWDLDGDGAYDDDTGETVTFDTRGLAPASYPVAVRGTSSASDLSAVATATVVVSEQVLQPPVAVLADPGGPFQGDQEIILDASGSTDPEGDGSTLTFSWDLDGDGAYDDVAAPAPGTLTRNAGDFEAGTTPVGVQVTSTVSGEQATASVDVIVHGPPDAQLVDPAGGPYVPGDEITLDASGSTEPQGAALRYDWDFDGDGSLDAVDAGAVVTYTAADAHLGSKIPYVVVTSELTGLRSNATTIVIVYQPPLVVVDSSQDQVQAGTSVTLDASNSTDPAGGDLTFAWDLDGDGEHDDATGPSADLDTTGMEPGEVAVSVAATSDQSGLTSTADRLVLIEAQGGGGAPGGGGGAPGGGGLPPPPPPADPTADLSVTLLAQPQEVTAGDTVELLATVTNAGPDAAQAFLGLEFAGLVADAAPGGCRIHDTGLSCEPFELDLGDRATVSVTLTVPTGGTFPITAEVTTADAIEIDGEDNTATTTVTGIDPQLTVADPPPELDGGPDEVAVAVSQQLFRDAGGFAQADGRAAATHVVLSRDDTFADSLTGAALTGNGPLLFTDTEALDRPTLAEIQRILPRGGEVLLLGGEAAIGTAVQADLVQAGFTVRRLAGPSRVETAVAIAEEVMSRHGAPSHVAIARADGPAGNPTAAWADSVSAGGWAARTGQPILLTATDGLHPAVAGWLDGQTDVVGVLLGGTAALSTEVAAAVGPHVRHAGANRYETAAVIAQQRWSNTTGYLVTAGDHPQGWAYGLATAALSARDNTPLLLVERDRLPAETAVAVCGPVRRDVQVVGGADVVSAGVRQALGC